MNIKKIFLSVLFTISLSFGADKTIIIGATPTPYAIMPEGKTAIGVIYPVIGVFITGYFYALFWVLIGRKSHENN
ncbi:hypothetical protein [Campylobacter jejuni]|uniref:hypothetical protein n=1 Tax=Campylobacter jejuni TaxID=197 RepID=UPI00069B37C7